MKRFSFVAAVLAVFSLGAFAGKNPANYPLKVHILQQAWGSHNVRYSEYRATGRGNIWNGDDVHAFDFSYDCSFGVRRTARNQPYPGKWKKPDQRLALLAFDIGKPEKYHECDLKTTVHPGVYIMSAGGITEMSQAEYKEWKSKRSAQPDTASSAVSRLSVASTPDSAEIEIDGEFMGNTPSVLDLDPGEHTVTVRKAGYAPWERKMKLAAGDVKLNAELEQQATN
ncbi:MAG TPA: PEGA domain-containing protein [Candidatus Angelobacter sp.]|jgi:hypothetical protein|nr:PEGA domain-containing protein [Candidatus Angelobacter sp.]